MTDPNDPTREMFLAETAAVREHLAEQEQQATDKAAALLAPLEAEEPQPAPDGPAPTALRIRVLTEILGRLRSGSDGDSVTEQLGAATVRSVLAEIFADMQPAPVLQPAPVTPAEAADEDAQRTARRRTTAVLLSRMQHGVLTADERQLLRQHVEAETREHDTMRAVARSNRRHVQTIAPEIERLTAELEGAEKRASGFLADLKRAWGERDRARAAIERVRALHTPTETGECTHCHHSYDPCPTVSALDRNGS